MHTAYINNLLQEMVQIVEGETVPEDVPAAPSPLCSGYMRPNKEAAIRAHKSRFQIKLLIFYYCLTLSNNLIIKKQDIQIQRMQMKEFSPDTHHCTTREYDPHITSQLPPTPSGQLTVSCTPIPPGSSKDT